MSTTSEQQASYNKKVNWVAHFFVTVVILIITAAVLSALFSSKPEARRWGGDRPAPSVAVDIADIEVRDFEVWVDSYGTAEPLTQTGLVAEVSGRVNSVSEKIRAGASFKKGDVLVSLDSRDYEVEVDIAASAEADAQLRYLQEVAEAELAAQQWNKQPTTEAARLLALRKPQVAAAESALRAAKARLERAKLNLERTTIVAPFDGRVLTQMVDVGQVVSPSQMIANIYSTDAIEVRLPVKIADLEHLYLPSESGSQLADDAEQPRVRLLGELGSQTYQWDGIIVRSEGAFDPSTRMLYLVAQVDRPFENTDSRPAIRVGQFLRAQVQGSTLRDVIVIPRRAVSQDNMVSVADEGVLRKRRIEPLWTDASSVVVASNPLPSKESVYPQDSFRSALSASDKLILTPTANLPDGTKVKAILTEQDTPPSPAKEINTAVNAVAAN
ncbi:efflux RND transporter periplasmic adaptor subunit [Glaciecola sp. MH2013]|uniref:efflux RND transporter periplasmic adaptor subunit n=1 Tax=Glaciecola sp. MH2013 TaxID=2785524 RepID=UPI0018A08277|nr:efflux RND transporter periplasmic adaptor subunit [Glaciecola sp. MH2013]MBF7074925.1 efflux RND transporter periplasmic adaptor subunit [Glaciecola sp. MH2013]